MLHRDVRLPARGSVLLFGPRQTGKSTLIRSLLPKDAFVVDLLHRETFLRHTLDPAAFRGEATARIAAGAKTIFIDEVQRIPDLLNEVHALIESSGARFFLTGSSARKLRRGGVNLLAGRAAVRRLHPLTIGEQGDLFDLERTLRLGSLPAVVTAESDDAALDLLRSYGDTYLHEEIQQEALVRNLGGFGRFLNVAAAQCGDILNASSIARDAAVATRTVLSYFEILEDTLLGLRLEPWRKSVRARLVGHPRFYFFDTGVTNALNRRFGAAIDPALRGRLFEQWIVLECARAIDNAQSEARLFYWRTNVGAEVDLVIERHGKLRAAIEIKSKRKVVPADFSGLRSFAAENPKVPLVVVAEVPAAARVGEVDVLPYRQFLERLPDWTG